MFDPEDNCAICMDTLSTGPVCHPSSCRDFFHKKCLDQWLNTAKSCPCCRAVVTGTVDATASSARSAAYLHPVPRTEERWTRSAANRYEQPQDLSLSEEDEIQIAMAISLADSEQNPQAPIVNAAEEGDDLQHALALLRADNSSRGIRRTSVDDEDIQLALAMSISEAEQANHAQTTNAADEARRRTGVVHRAPVVKPETRIHTEEDEDIQLALAMSLSEQTAAAEQKKNAAEEARLRRDVVNRSVYEDIKNLPNLENDEDLQLALALSISLQEQIDEDHKLAIALSNSTKEQSDSAERTNETEQPTIDSANVVIQPAVAPSTVPPATVPTIITTTNSTTTITLPTPTVPFTITIMPFPPAPTPGGAGSSREALTRPADTSSSADISAVVVDFLQTPSTTTTTPALPLTIVEPTIAPTEPTAGQTEDDAMRFVMEMTFGSSEETSGAPIMSSAEEAALMRDLFDTTDE